MWSFHINPEILMDWNSSSPAHTGSNIVSVRPHPLKTKQQPGFTCYYKARKMIFCVQTLHTPSPSPMGRNAGGRATTAHRLDSENQFSKIKMLGNRLKQCKRANQGANFLKKILITWII
jgi:hypothetical protein